MLARYSDASNAFEQALKLAPDDLQAHAFLGVTEFLDGNKEAAMKQYDYLLQHNPAIAAELLRGFGELSEELRKVERIKADRQKLRSEQNH